MAMTRKFLSALGIEADKIDEIITAHTETISGLKEERDKYKVDAERLPIVQKELDDLKDSHKDDDDYKKKFDVLDKEYKEYKQGIADKQAADAKKAAYREMLKESKISEKRLDTILKVTDFSKIELDKEGKLKDAEGLKKGIETEWADFIETTETRGAQTTTPPSGNDKPHGTGRAKELAAQYHANKYGVAKKED